MIAREGKRMKKRVIRIILVSIFILISISGCGKRDIHVVIQNEEKLKEDTSDDIDVHSKVRIPKKTEKNVVNEPENKDTVSAYTAEKDPDNAYKRFLGIGTGRNMSAIVDPDVRIGLYDKDAELVYSEQSLETIKTYLYKGNKDNLASAKISYTYIDVDGQKEMVVCLDGFQTGSGKDKELTILIVNHYDGELHISHSFNIYEKDYLYMHDNGYVVCEMTDEEGKAVHKEGYIDSAGYYIEVYNSIELINDQIADYVDKELYMEAYDNGKEHPNFKVYIYTFEPDNCALMYMLEDNKQLSDVDNMFLDQVGSKGIDWYSEPEIEYLINQRLLGLGVDNTKLTSDEIKWIKLD